jgi:peptide methionine sulfoxide reductase MsrB
MEYNKLTSEEERVIVHKGTERPGTTIKKQELMYAGGAIRHCTIPMKFDSHCGWPSFDDEIKGAVKHFPDADGSWI